MPQDVPTNPVDGAQRPGRDRRLGLGLVAMGAALAVGVVGLGTVGLVQWPGRSSEAAPQVQGSSEAAAASQPRGSQEVRRGKPSPVRLAFAGDVHFEGTVGEALARDPASVLAGVSTQLSSADIAVVNLETAVTDRGTAAPKAFTFRAPGAAFLALEAGGVDAASMANNHGMDFGLQGLTDSLGAAREHEFPVIGIGNDESEAYAPYVRTVKGQRIAVIAATQVLDSNLLTAWTAGPGKPGLASAKRVDRLVAAVRDASAQADVVVVFLHWGTEKAHCPNPAQQQLAPVLAQAGADIVVGGHAHRVQGGGFLGKAYVDYGLGNFAFDLARNAEARDSGVLTVRVAEGKVLDAAWHPVELVDGLPVARQDPAAVAAAQQRKDSYRACAGLSDQPTTPAAATPSGSPAPGSAG